MMIMLIAKSPSGGMAGKHRDIAMPCKLFAFDVKRDGKHGDVPSHL